MSDQGRPKNPPPARGISAQALGRAAVPPTKSTLNRLVTDLRPGTSRPARAPAPTAVFDDLEAELSKDPASRGPGEPTLPTFGGNLPDLSTLGASAPAPPAAPPASGVAFRGTQPVAPRNASDLGKLLGFEGDSGIAPLNPFDFEAGGGPSLDFALPGDLPPIPNAPVPTPPPVAAPAVPVAPTVVDMPAASRQRAPSAPVRAPSVPAAPAPPIQPHTPPVASPRPATPIARPAPPPVAPPPVAPPPVAPPPVAPPPVAPAPVPVVAATSPSQDVTRPSEPEQPSPPQTPAQPKAPSQPPPPKFEQTPLDTQVVRASKVLERARETKKEEQSAGRTNLKEPDAPIPPPPAPPPPQKKGVPVPAIAAAAVVLLIAAIGLMSRGKADQFVVQPVQVADPNPPATPATTPAPTPPTPPAPVEGAEPAKPTPTPNPAPAPTPPPAPTLPAEPVARPVAPKAPARPRPTEAKVDPTDLVTFRFEVTPAEATVSIDGQLVSGNEARVPRSDGDHVVDVSAPGFLPQQHLLSARLSARLRVELDPRPKGWVSDRAPTEPTGESPAPAAAAKAQLSIDSDPAGAEVQIDGKRVGYAPLGPIEVDAGSHTVRVFREGYEDFVKDVSAPAGESVKVSADLKKITP
ncbi:MAG: PEGA domain-containing protein [Deltaproteobacteria bacterium]|nr:PEGA domain-containing protein [Deltaproteobacteria bacterium]